MNDSLTKCLTQIREQMSVPDLYVLTVVFLALTKTGFSEIKKIDEMIFAKNFARNYEKN